MSTDITFSSHRMSKCTSVFKRRFHCHFQHNDLTKQQDKTDTSWPCQCCESTTLQICSHTLQPSPNVCIYTNMLEKDCATFPSLSILVEVGRPNQFIPVPPLLYLCVHIIQCHNTCPTPSKSVCAHIIQCHNTCPTPSKSVCAHHSVS